MNATKTPRNPRPFPWLLVAIGLLVLHAHAQRGQVLPFAPNPLICRDGQTTPH